MKTRLILPKETAELIEKLPLKSRHPGLQLDKFSPPGEQKKQHESLNEVVKTVGDETLLRALYERRGQYLKSLAAATWLCETAGPFTLHLSRASALENAGICLHPLYGFVYLPASGLKGMARAFAETVWLPAQTDREEAEEKILSVFGNAPGEPKEERQRAGAVIFHDAWPASWPRLIVDIVNCHHRDYYKGNAAPGDRQNPVPVYFLAVGPGQKFSFAVSKRRGDVPDEIVRLAREWLIGALTCEGAGAKTAAGYGAFKLVEDGEALAAVEKAWDGAKERAVRAEFHATLELVTPAFLAGASQEKEDCDLRPATLRGLLRCWWRTMHAGFVDVPTLRAMEAAVWGDTNVGGAVRVTVERSGAWQPELYNKNNEQKSSEHGIRGRDPRKTTQGLWYVRRWFIPPGAKWTVRLVARPSQYLANDKKGKGRELSAESVLEEAKRALWLLCHFGGVGSKSRKGFGSFADVVIEGVTTPDDCKRAAAKFRQMCGLTAAEQSGVRGGQKVSDK